MGDFAGGSQWAHPRQFGGCGIMLRDPKNIQVALVSIFIRFVCHNGKR